MIESFIHFVQEFLLPLGAPGIFAAAVMEEVIAPIPSAAVMMGAGFFFLSGGWSTEFALTLVLKVALPIALGVTVGSLFIYGLLYASGKPALDRWGKWLGLSWKDVEDTERRFASNKRRGLALLALRALPIVPSVAIAAFCGLVRFDLRIYIAFTFLGAFVRSLVLGIAGWQLGNVYSKYAMSIDNVSDIVLITIACAIAVAVLARMYAFMYKKA